MLTNIKTLIGRLSFFNKVPGLNKREKDNRPQEFKAFETESDTRLAGFIFACLLLFFSAGIYLTLMDIVMDIILIPDGKTKYFEAKFIFPKDKKTPPKTAAHRIKKPRNSKKPGGGQGGQQRGKPKDITGMGLLYEVSSISKSSTNQVFKKINGTIERLETTLSKIGVLNKTGKTVLGGRQGKTNVPWNSAYSDLEGDGGSPLDGLLPPGDAIIAVDYTKKQATVKSPKIVTFNSPTARRSATSILKIVKSRMPGLRYIYNKHLKYNPGFRGKINIRFEIAPSGKTVSVKIISSTTAVQKFDYEIKNRVRSWRFTPIEGKGNDIVTIPFTFSE
ncbi:MAG: energy transducer TonB [Fibrobacteria bacterium]|nr:energy transducer TonB [Fibrobacteria bacterium]